MMAEHVQRLRQPDTALRLQLRCCEVRSVFRPIEMSLVQQGDFGPQMGDAVDSVQRTGPGNPDT